MKVIHSSAHRSTQGNVIILALFVITVLCLIAGHVMRVTMPRYITTTQTATWRQARATADQGIDFAISAITQNLPDPTATTASWNGWSNWTANYNGTGSSILSGNNAVTSSTLNSLKISNPIILDNYATHASSTTGTTDRQVDVELRTLFPDTNYTTNIWYKVRSMGTAALTLSNRTAIDKMDTTLRRMTTSNWFTAGNIGRPVLTDTNHWGAAPVFNPPYATRIVEVLLQPYGNFNNAIETSGTMALGNSNNWLVDSYDSTNGFYTTSGSDGNIATSGTIIVGNGAIVQGNASTNNGTVTGASNVKGTISNDFNDTLDSPTQPSGTGPWSTSGVFTATPGSTKYYVISSKSDTVSSSMTFSGTGTVVLVMDLTSSGNNQGTWSPTSVTIPSSVNVQIYIRGNIDFKNNSINYGSGSSQNAANLLIYGLPSTSSGGSAFTISASGNGKIVAALYAPDYDATISGTEDWYGSIVVHNYSINGGGNGGMHYDVNLAKKTPAKKVNIISYIEDSRQ